MKKYQVFVSSTYKDLRDERQAAVEAILKAGHIPAGMELFAAGNESQWETIKRWIDSCDLYMLILGSRYGSIEPKTGLSYTELEYDYALSKGLPFFAVVIKDAAIDEKVKLHGKEVLELKNPAKLSAFRSKVLGKTSTFFLDTKDVKLAVFESISDLEKRHTLAGWIPANEIPDTKPLLAEIQRLTELATTLEKDKRTAESKLAKLKSFDGQDAEFKVLHEVLNKENVSTGGYEEAFGGQTRDVNVMHMLYLGCSDFATGVENSLNSSTWHGFLFWIVAPALQVHDLVVFNKVPGVKWRRCEFTEKGKSFVSYLKRSGVFEAFNKAMAEVKKKAQDKQKKQDKAGEKS